MERFYLYLLFATSTEERQNLTLETHAHVKRLVANGNKAVKVEYQQRGKDLTVKARCEIIICAGAVNSPQLLELSGIGDPARLSSLGIKPIHNLPQVGENLSDHLGACLLYTSPSPRDRG